MKKILSISRDKIVVPRLGYFKSSHRSLYNEIAARYIVSPSLVYLLAHGRRPHHLEEVQILEELFNSGVIVLK